MTSWLTLYALDGKASSVTSKENDIQLENQTGLNLNSGGFYFKINGRLMVDFATCEGCCAFWD